MGATIPVITVIIAVLNGVSVIALLGATIIGAENYRETSSISNYWLFFTITAATGSLLFGLATLKRIDILKTFTEQVVIPIGFTFIVLLIVTSFETLKSDIGVTVR